MTNMSRATYYDFKALPKLPPPLCERNHEQARHNKENSDWKQLTLIKDE
jgi:hypothetical protein